LEQFQTPAIRRGALEGSAQILKLLREGIEFAPCRARATNAKAEGDEDIPLGCGKGV